MKKINFQVVTVVAALVAVFTLKYAAQGQQYLEENAASIFGLSNAIELLVVGVLVWLAYDRFIGKKVSPQDPKLIKSFDLIERLFNDRRPTSHDDMNILLEGHIAKFEGILTGLKEINRNIKLDATNQGFRSVLQILDLLVTKYTQKSSATASAQKKASDLELALYHSEEAKQNLSDQLAKANQSNEGLNKANAEMSERLRAFMEAFAKMDPANPLVAQLAKAEGKIEGIEQGNALAGNIVSLNRAPAKPKQPQKPKTGEEDNEDEARNG